MGDMVFIQLSKDELRDFIRKAVEDSISELRLMPKKEEKEALVKIEDICDMLQVSRVTIHKWKKSGRIPFHKISNRIFFKKSEIESSLKSIDISKFKIYRR